MSKGIYTSEFWLTIGKQLFALLVLAGVIATSDRARLEGAFEVAVTAAFALVTAAWTVSAYIRSRTEVKTTESVPEAQVGPPTSSFEQRKTTTGLGVLPFLLAGTLAGWALGCPAMEPASPAAEISAEVNS